MLHYPSHLTIAGKEAVKSSEIAHNLLQGLSNHQLGQGLHSTHHCRVSHFRVTNSLYMHFVFGLWKRDSGFSSFWKNSTFLRADDVQTQLGHRPGIEPLAFAVIQIKFKTTYI